MRRPGCWCAGGRAWGLGHAGRADRRSRREHGVDRGADAAGPDALAGAAEQIGRITWRSSTVDRPTARRVMLPRPGLARSDAPADRFPWVGPSSSAGLLGSTAIQVRVLAGRQWVATPTLLGLELLSAFVQPQDPALDTVLATASSRLAASTGRADLTGPTADPDRTDAVAAAVFGALADAGVRVIAAPLGRRPRASWCAPPPRCWHGSPAPASTSPSPTQPPWSGSTSPRCCGSPTMRCSPATGGNRTP